MTKKQIDTLACLLGCRVAQNNIDGVKEIYNFLDTARDLFLIDNKELEKIRAEFKKVIDMELQKKREVA